MSRATEKWGFLASPYFIWSIGFTVIPLGMIFVYAFTDAGGAFTMDNLLAIASPINRKAFWYSLVIAFSCTIICILLAYPLVMALKHLDFSRGRFILFVLIMPMWMNFILRLLAWQMLLSNNGIINYVLRLFGAPPIAIANTSAAVMIGVVYEYLPYVVLPIYTAIDDIDRGILEAARDLGAGPLRTFFRVILPMSLPGLKSGITMVFVPAMTSFVIADILGGGKLQLIGNIIEQEFNLSMNWHLGSGLSVSLMIFVLISMAFTSQENNRKGETSLWAEK